MRAVSETCALEYDSTDDAQFALVPSAVTKPSLPSSSGPAVKLPIVSVSSPGPAGSVIVIAVVAGIEDGRSGSLHSAVISSQSSGTPAVFTVPTHVPLVVLCWWRKPTGTGPAPSAGAAAANDARFPPMSWIPFPGWSPTLNRLTLVSGWSVQPPIARVAVLPLVETDWSDPPDGTFESVHPAVHGAAQAASGSLNVTVTWSTKPSAFVSSIVMPVIAGGVLSPAAPGSRTPTPVVDELLPDTASNCVPATEAALISVWGEPGAVIGMVIVSLSPDAMAPRSHVTVAAPEHDPAVVMTLPARDEFVGGASVTVASGSGLGPLFVTVSV